MHEIYRWVTDLLAEWIAKQKTGSLTINFFRGGITNVTKNESIKGK